MPELNAVVKKLVSAGLVSETEATFLPSRERLAEAYRQFAYYLDDAIKNVLNPEDINKLSARVVYCRQKADDISNHRKRDYIKELQNIIDYARTKHWTRVQTASAGVYFYLGDFYERSGFAHSFHSQPDNKIVSRKMICNDVLFIDDISPAARDFPNELTAPEPSIIDEWKKQGVDYVGWLGSSQSLIPIPPHESVVVRQSEGLLLLRTGIDGEARIIDGRVAQRHQRWTAEVSQPS